MVEKKFAAKEGKGQQIRWGECFIDQAFARPVDPAFHIVPDPSGARSGAQSGDGRIAMPNVDLAEQTVEMIVAKTAYKANAAVIEVAHADAAAYWRYPIARSFSAMEGSMRTSVSRTPSAGAAARCSSMISRMRCNCSGSRSTRARVLSSAARKETA